MFTTAVAVTVTGADAFVKSVSSPSCGTPQQALSLVVIFDSSRRAATATATHAHYTPENDDE